MNETQALQFVRTYAAGEPVSAEEQLAFREWLLLHSDAEIEQWLHTFPELFQRQAIFTPVNPEWTNRLLQRMNREEAAPVIAMRPRRFPFRMVAAAVALFLVATTVFFLVHRSALPPIGTAQRYKNDVAPGGNHASLKLADGTVVLLDSIQSGTLAKQGAVTIVKNDSGRLVYRVLPGDIAGSNSYTTGNPVLAYNTLSTPKGGQFRVELPDGSAVWLNAASSLRFPTSFTGKERRVELTGEAYFEVAKAPQHAQMPFIVQMNSFQVAVLGTHFNVNAYPGDAVHQVTLLQGKVRVEQGNRQQVIAPGQQATISNGITVAEADTDEAIAWKNGLFQFSNTPLVQVMQQVERWYNIHVDYNDIPEKHFYGIISRNSSLSQVLSMLEVTGGVKFGIEGNTVKLIR